MKEMSKAGKKQANPSSLTQHTAQVRPAGVFGSLSIGSARRGATVLQPPVPRLFAHAEPAEGKPEDAS